MLDYKRDIDIILDQIDGFLIIDENERIIFMSQSLLNTVGMPFPTVKGRRLRDVISSNNTYKVLESGEKRIGETYLVPDSLVVSNSYPIFIDGKIAGAIEFDIFGSLDQLQDFFEKISKKKDLYHFSEAISRKRTKYSLDNIKGSSNIIKNLKSDIQMVGKSNSTVLIMGETGSGKELIARAVHMAGNRSIFEFVDVNCATIPTELFESELFGYEEGSFTGARRGGKQGLVERADKGTLFLDEVNTLPLPMQAKLLRFLQEREVYKVGGGKPTQVDVRIISATNEDLETLVNQGKFRRDLYYRLNVIELIAEPLRKRKSDIPELVNHFIQELNTQLVRILESDQVKSVDNDVLKLLMDYDWPGNVRELRNVIERAMNRCSDNTLRMEHFSDFFIKASISGMNLDGQLEKTLDLRKLKQKVEIYAINEVLNNRGLSFTEASKELGITRQMLYKKVKDYNIPITGR